MNKDEQGALRYAVLQEVAAHFDKSHREMWTPEIAQEIRSLAGYLECCGQFSTNGTTPVCCGEPLAIGIKHCTDERTAFEVDRLRIATEVSALNLSPVDGEELALFRLWQASRRKL